jgi:hypothetical protein
MHSLQVWAHGWVCSDKIYEKTLLVLQKLEVQRAASQRGQLTIYNISNVLLTLVQLLL